MAKSDRSPNSMALHPFCPPNVGMSRGEGRRIHSNVRR
ncbi:Hypothetical protein A7982_01230 [Minicystis rosea]|nr:Hypothetical protein A7982_01230 [Minicystis rosea]